MTDYTNRIPRPEEASDRLAAAKQAGQTVIGSAADIAESIVNPKPALDPEDFRNEP